MRVKGERPKECVRSGCGVRGGAKVEELGVLIEHQVIDIPPMKWCFGPFQDCGARQIHAGQLATTKVDHLSEAMVKVAVKWNKRVFADVEVTPTVADFKAKLQELTVRNLFGHIPSRNNGDTPCFSLEVSTPSLSCCAIDMCTMLSVANHQGCYQIMLRLLPERTRARV